MNINEKNLRGERVLSDKVKIAQMIFQEHEIPFSQMTSPDHPRGELWLVIINGYKYFYYPETYRWAVEWGTREYHSRGAADFLGKVFNYQSKRWGITI